MVANELTELALEATMCRVRYTYHSDMAYLRCTLNKNRVQETAQPHKTTRVRHYVLLPPISPVRTLYSITGFVYLVSIKKRELV